MQVRIEDRVFISLTEFYAISLALHPTLDKATVTAKKQRLIEALKSLSYCAGAFPLASVREDWIAKQYHDFHAEGFHFAYKIETLSSLERVVVVYDVCHDLLFHN